MKKLISVGLVLILMVSMLTACGTKNDNGGNNEVSVTPSSDNSNANTDPADGTTDSNAPAVGADTPVGIHGALHVDGAKLVDKDGNQVQLHGMSTHGIAWYPKFVSEETISYLYNDWNTNCIRLAMYTHENMGYCAGGDKDYLKGLVKDGVKYATDLGMYVIIDWHVLNEKSPIKYMTDALAFFDEMSAEFADYDNVLYEICNEPNGTGWDKITQYANEVIPVIRENDPDAVIICGTPTWSQDVDKAMAEPLAFDNVMYTLHFYAGTHGDWLRDRMETCINAGFPIFVSEFGICDASGNGALDYESGNAWKDLIEKYNVSYMCWNMANKDESSSIIKESCDKLSGWTDDELNEQGIWIRDWFLSETEK